MTFLKENAKVNARPICLIALLAQLLWVPNSAAQSPAADLYSTVVAVADQGDPERQKAIRLGLEQVLIRVTGRKDALENTMIRNGLARASEYLEQFNYTASAPDDPGGSAGADQSIRLKYEESLVNDWVRRARLPIWGSNRPNVVVWVTRERDGLREVLGNYDDNEFTKALNTAAQRRGVPLIYPLLDLEDQVNLSNLDAWGLFKDRIESASTRYGGDAILAGRSYQDQEGQWQWSWLFVFNGQSQRFSHADTDVNQSIGFAVDLAADRLGAHYAISTSASNRTNMTMWLEGIESLEDYDASLEYLDKLVAIHRIDLRQIQRDRIVLEIVTDTSKEKLQEELALDDQLVLVTREGAILSPPAQTGGFQGASLNGVTLRYRWRNP